jgi:hypothetical protein
MGRMCYIGCVLYASFPFSAGENIKVSIGGWFVNNCRIFIDHKQAIPKRYK